MLLLFWTKGTTGEANLARISYHLRIRASRGISGLLRPPGPTGSAAAYAAYRGRQTGASGGIKISALDPTSLASELNRVSRLPVESSHSYSK